MAQWITRMTRNWSLVISLNNKLYSHCLVLGGSRNRFEHYLHRQILLVSQSKHV